MIHLHLLYIFFINFFQGSFPWSTMVQTPTDRSFWSAPNQLRDWMASKLSSEWSFQEWMLSSRLESSCEEVVSYHLIIGGAKFDFAPLMLRLVSISLKLNADFGV